MNTSITKITLQGFKSFNKKISIPFLAGFNVICGPNGSGKSARGDTEVLLANGDLKTIREIVEERLEASEQIQKLDDGVLTYENPENLKVLGLNPETMKIEEKNILAFIKRKGEKELYRIQTRTGKSVVTTGCHPVMIFRDGMIISEVVSKLKCGDLIATPAIIRLNGQSLDIQTELEISFPSEIFARFLGYLIGDGYIRNDRFEFTNEDNDLIEDMLYLCKKLNIKPKLRIDGKIKVVSFYSTEFCKFLFNLFELEKISSGTKQIPKIFLFANEKVISNLLAALFDCDGYVRKNGTTIEYASKSEKLAKQIQFLLLRLGIVSRLKARLQRATNSNQQKEKYYYIFIGGIKNLKTFYEKIPLKSKDKVERLKSILSKNVKPQRRKEDILPKDVNKSIKKVVRLLGLEIKKLRKQYPTLAAYVENRCYPTIDGVKGILPLFLNRIKEIEELKNELKLEKDNLLEILHHLKISRRDASRAIGLHEDSITNSWIQHKSKSRRENLKKLYKFVRLQISERLKESKRLVKILESLTNSDIFWDKVVKIEKVPGEEWVYDLSIPNCHNFIANGIFVHNSNIIDAICFVLGRTSAKSLRAERLHELIFHGGGNKKPADYAAVTLYLDNSKKIFPSEEPEVSITRKVNRKGVSIYKINGRTTTREKVLEFLSSARIYPDGHNIVLQGDVTNIIEMSPIERRLIIDEISGIAEYNDKREKAQKDLAAVDQKLKEAEIIITQKYDIFKKLEEESNAAKKYQDLQKKLTILKASYAFKKLKTLEERINKLEDQISDLEEKNLKINEQIEKTEEELDRRESNIREIADKLIEISKKVKIEKEVSELRSKILITKDKIDSNLREIERINSLVEKLEALEAKAEEIPRAVQSILNLKLKGVYGTVASLISVPEKYSIAIEVAAGPHLYDIVTENDEVASYCIEYLKRERIGRATFLPLNKIRPILFKDIDLLNKPGVIGVASKLIKYETKFMPAMEFVFGNTLIVENLDSARAVGIGKARMVTLDGDLIERSGAMIGGYFIKTHPKFIEATRKKEIENYLALRKKLEEETEDLKSELEELEKELKKFTTLETTKELIDLEKLRISSERELDELREKRRRLYERRLSLQNELNKLKIEKARIEAEKENTKIEVEQYGEIQYIDEKLSVLEEFIAKVSKELSSIGLVNLRAIDEYERFKLEFDEYRKKYEKILEEKKAVLKMIEEIEEKRREVFHKCLKEVSEHFNRIFFEMMKGNASLELENPLDLESGLIIQANPRGKTLLNIDSMSGGEKTLTALAFLFAIQRYKPAPFYIFDEVDAALDKENSKIVAELIKKLSKEAQFIVITHNDQTIKYGDRVYGVTMAEGESKILGLELPR